MTVVFLSYVLILCHHIWISLCRGSLAIRAEAQANTKELFCVTFKGTKLANKDGFFGASDPFLVISR